MHMPSAKALAPIPDWLAEQLRQVEPMRWVVTGCAGFIGSNLIENLLLNNQHVVGVDNYSTGHKENLESVLTRIGDKGKRFHFYEGDIQNHKIMQTAMSGADIVLHQAALGSVPRSIEDPVASFNVNVNGFINTMTAARDANVRAFIYASSSAVYGDHPALPKVESTTGRPLSPYAGTKASNELFAQIYSDAYSMQCTGLRYFNVFGPRQDPNGPYAAVIPRWTENILKGRGVTINGDGSTSRDFCFVANVVQANLLAGLRLNEQHKQRIFNIAFGSRTNLLELHGLIQTKIGQRIPNHPLVPPTYQEFRKGDVLHSHANIDSAREQLGYLPEYDVSDGLSQTLDWYIN
jgi:UDP-N-acetylglucosamine/UDP-N-acetylgalactosamine 4-epimerase